MIIFAFYRRRRHKPSPSSMSSIVLSHDIVSVGLQNQIVSFVDEILEKGRNNEAPGRTYGHEDGVELLRLGAFVSRSDAGEHVVSLECLPLPHEVHDLCNLLVQRQIVSSRNRPNSCSIFVSDHGLAKVASAMSKHCDPSLILVPITKSIRVMEMNGNGLGPELNPGSTLYLRGPEPISYTNKCGSGKCIVLALRLIRSAESSKENGGRSKKATKREARMARKKERKEAIKAANAQRSNRGKVDDTADSVGAKSSPIPDHLLPQIQNENQARVEEKTPTVELEHVHRVYDTIAPHWHGTRYQAWPKVASFIQELPAGSLIGDLGCGNGKVGYIYLCFAFFYECTKFQF